MNKLICIVNKIFSILFRVMGWIRRHWALLRKILVIFLILGGLVYQLSSPDVNKKINKSTVNIVLHYEQKAISFEKSGKFSDAIDCYKNAVAIILSQKKLLHLDIDNDIQYRIYKNAALLILDYSKSNTLTDSQKSLIPTLINELSVYPKNMEHDINLNKILSDINLLQK